MCYCWSVKRLRTKEGRGGKWNMDFLLSMKNNFISLDRKEFLGRVYSSVVDKL